METTGYGLRRDNTPNSGINPLPAPADFQVSHGVLSGTLDIKVSLLTGAVSYEVQLSQLDLLIEKNWSHAASSKTATHIQLTNLIPAQAYWIRVRALGTNGNGVWTGPIHIIVV